MISCYGRRSIQCVTMSKIDYLLLLLARKCNELEKKANCKDSGSKAVSIKKLHTSDNQITVRAGDTLKLQCIFAAKWEFSIFIFCQFIEFQTCSYSILVEVGRSTAD